MINQQEIDFVSKRDKLGREPTFHKLDKPDTRKYLETINERRDNSVVFCRFAKIHKDGQEKMLTIAVTEFNPFFADNSHLMPFSVRGSYVKPYEKIKWFKTLEEVKNYVLHIMESTDIWLSTI